MSRPDPILRVDELSVSYRTPRGRLRALRQVGFEIQPGEIVGIVGESGCGKSTLISTIIRLLAANADVDGGRLEFRGEDLLSASEERLRALRGDEIAERLRTGLSARCSTSRNILKACRSSSSPALRTQACLISRFTVIILSKRPLKYRDSSRFLSCLRICS